MAKQSDPRRQRPPHVTRFIASLKGPSARAVVLDELHRKQARLALLFRRRDGFDPAFWVRHSRNTGSIPNLQSHDQIVGRIQTEIDALCIEIDRLESTLYHHTDTRRSRIHA